VVTTTAQIWDWLAELPDPEIPVLSLVDLGVIRDVAEVGGSFTVTITPTYSGCPATSVIEMDVRAKLEEHGVPYDLKRQINPPWTTDWISADGRAKLEEYGIAPPNTAKGPDHCPRCKSTDLERISQFGSTPCKAQWRCKSCLEPFDYFKCI
jgi:ring-1,2-phenylacetyl-CoA epoxidase subunit PaaD